MVMLIPKASVLKTMAGDVRSPYLEAYIQEKVYLIAGLEFGSL